MRGENKTTRNEFLCMTGTALAGLVFSPTQLLTKTKNKNSINMYGLIVKMTAKTGQRDELIEILIEGSADMPGCLCYIVSEDSEDEDAIWITEVWETKESQKQSLELSSVQEAMKKGRPLISEFNKQIEMEPVGGHGLAFKENK